ncbi:patatin-like phospholipase family protein [Crassaminicella profunda]|uniref:patatin-like phospholipase family protein n=1 Tax=Crassaminicella profunda TaxID=1286698 RepID=UPI001CA76F5E|nr:patatin-like phospholipase family protein [Crassaminicella profunda]
MWGIAHIGVLKALEENNIPIHYISGTSIGSLIGGLYALGTSTKKLSSLATSTHWNHLCRISLPLGGLFSNEPMEKFLYNLIGEKTFSDVKIPFSAITTDLITGEEVVIHSGKISTAIRASTAIPGIFHPVLLNNRTLVDGGVVNNVPIHVLREMGADVIIGVNLSPDFNHWRPKNSFEIILKSFLIMQNKVARSELEKADIIIDMNMKDFNPMDFRKAKDLLKKGYKEGLSKIEEIQHTLK